MKARAIRTLMAGGGNSYDVYIPIEEIPHYDPAAFTTTMRFNDRLDRYEHFWDFVYALIPAEHFKMETGWDRYADFLQHEKKLKKSIMPILTKLFPELFGIDTLPELWIPYLNYPSKEIDFELPNLLS